MKKLAILYTVALLVLLIMSQVVGCQEQPAPTPAPTEALPPTPAPTEALPPTPAPTPKPPATLPPPPDEPSLSENEVCSYVWSQLPFELPNEYKKSQFLMLTRESTYEGNGEWKFVVLGSAKKDVGPTSTEIYEKTPDHWFEKESQEVTTCELKLTAVLNEETKILEITSIDEFNEQVKTEWTETPIIAKKLQLHRLLAHYDGSSFDLEGSVENTGLVPLENVQVEMLFYGDTDNLTTIQSVPLSPETIAVGETVEFQLNFMIEEKFKSYDYRFVLSSGEKIPYSVSWPRILGQLLVHWVEAGQSVGWRGEFQGAVENTGQAPLKDVQVQMFFFDDDGNLVRTEMAPLSPETIAVGEMARFHLVFTSKSSLIIKTYKYRFILPSGQGIPLSVEGK